MHFERLDRVVHNARVDDLAERDWTKHLGEFVTSQIRQQSKLQESLSGLSVGAVIDLVGEIVVESRQRNGLGMRISVCQSRQGDERRPSARLLAYSRSVAQSAEQFRRLSLGERKFRFA